jgi:hypothetical protein
MSKNKIGTPLYTEFMDLANGGSTTVSLWAMHRIEVKCGDCQSKKLGTTMSGMLTQMNGAYGDLLVIIYITAIGGGLCMLWCAYLVWRRSESTQSEYL